MSTNEELQKTHFVDRTGWPSGPWDDEPDREEFEHEGFPCLIVRGRSGALCGYVGVPPGHGLHGEKYEVPAVQIHGGLTYSESCHERICHVPKPGEPDNVWWFGFDCAHGYDIVPLHEMLFRNMGEVSGCRYRNMAYVRDQVKSLAEQLSHLNDPNWREKKVTYE